MKILSQDKTLYLEAKTSNIIHFDSYHGRIMVDEHEIGYYNEKDGIKILENMIFYLEQDISNFIYKMPQPNEVNNLKNEIINRDKNKKMKIFMNTNKDFLSEEVNSFMEDKNFIDFKISNDNNYFIIAVIYSEKENQKIIKKEDIAAIEISNSSRKIYEIKNNEGN